AEADASVAPAASNPLQLGMALQMAAIFQVVLIALHEVRERFGGVGLRWAAVLLGLTDVDALTASMAAQTAPGARPGAGRGRHRARSDREHRAEACAGRGDRPRPVRLARRD